jgi:hypothetical protein
MQFSLASLVLGSWVRETASGRRCVPRRPSDSCSLRRAALQQVNTLLIVISIFTVLSGLAEITGKKCAENFGGRLAVP